MNEKDLKRFWKQVNKTEGCWLWASHVTKAGYGEVSINNKSKKAHRVSYEISFGEIPEGLLVCHTCDNRKCVNPEHLFLGTHKDNYDDMIRKGRNSILFPPQPRIKKEDRPPKVIIPKIKKEKKIRGEGPYLNYNARKTHCKRGHELAGENLLIVYKQRKCKICFSETQKKYYYKTYVSTKRNRKFED